MSVTKEEFFATIAEPQKEKVLTFNGKDYRLRAMTEEIGCDYEIEMASGGKWDIKKARRAMIALMLLDDSGNRIVDDDLDPGGNVVVHAESKLKSMPRGLAGVLYGACLELNTYDNGEIKELIKNSEPVEG